ncbi:signal peptide peptidase SppA [Chryseobacterium sp. R2A-55]|uniref:signal peptide peptidase SppA n=1 Tax=Chryseobacterium sp. R2A-55 TaxID=2744445 RepID=UPI001F3305BB|nr:signal peptide peptidase SppA [Chryseobacterium sp. R2A-55]
MKNFLKYVLANIVAIMVVIALFFIFIAFMVVSSAIGDSSKSSVRKNSVLTLDFNTNIIDSPTEDQDGMFSLNQKQQSNVLIYDMLEAIKKAKTDDKIMGISIETDGIKAGITQLDDVRAALEDFKKSGKFVYAYGNVVSQGAYYLGSVADQYFLNPSGGIELRGMSTEVPFFKNFADKYGIGIQVIRHGKFKAAVEPYMRNEISPENREQLSTLLNDIWGQTSTKIYRSRKIDSAQFRIAVDSLYAIIPDLSLKNKLVDKLLQKTEYDNLIKSKLKLSEKDKLHKITFSKYIDSYHEDLTKKDNQVAVLYASGAIYNGDGYEDVHAEKFVRDIKKLAENDKVKAVVFRVNSPGGSANASDEILFELEQLKKKKPLIISFGDYAASGGYYVAMGADKIYSEPNTITGSIGVFGVFAHVKELAARNGIRADEVSTNANSNMVSVLNGMSPGTVNIMTKSVEETYKRFVYFVTKNRKKSFEQIDEIGGGRVWSGTRAKQIGLVDELGSLNDAIRFAAQKANLKDYNVATYPKKISAWEQIFKNMEGEDLSARLIKSKIGTQNYKVFQQLTDPKMQNGVMMEMPYQVKF